MPDEVLSLRGVTRRFRQGGAWIEVLSGVDLRLAAGERAALVGPSGSGKSTLLQVAGLLDSPDGGEVRIGGCDAGGASDRVRSRLRRDRVGFVYQFHHLLPELTALENVALPAMIAGAGRAQAADRARELLRRAGLGARTDHRPARLSGGEQQRVAICRAIANRPVLLLADEPTGNLDAETAESVTDMLFGQLASPEMAMLVATHDMRFASKLDRRVTLRRGRLTDL